MTPLIPSARRLMASLRDIGYDPESAVADLVDNSIDAGARTIDISIVHEVEGSYVRIVDDGTGMTEGEIEEAMRYGSSRDYGQDDLGQYGLGLKTASLSQCRCLTIASKTSDQGRLRIRRWDMDLVDQTDEWILEKPGLRDVPFELTEPLETNKGTVVLWEDLDRILGYSDPNGHHAKAYMSALSDSISAHLSMIFHRFLSGEHRRKVTISVNGTNLKAWDPFARSETMTRELSEQKLTFEQDGKVHSVTIRPYILPAQYHFSSTEAHEKAGGPSRWNRQQGLYIYRRDRLIQTGGWNRLRTFDEHSKLARIAVDLPAGAESAFRINVAKMTVTLPQELRGSLRTLLAAVVAEAQAAYRQRMRLVPDSEVSSSRSEVAAAGTGQQLGDIWQVVDSTLRRELAGDPELLDRLLVALVNEPPVERSIRTKKS